MAQTAAPLDTIETSAAPWTDEQLAAYVVPNTCPMSVVRDMKKAFDYLDEDGSGSLEVREFLAAVKALNISLDTQNGQTTPEQAIKIALHGTTEITFGEFMTRMTSKLEPTDTADEVLRIFEMFDQDQTGSISKNDLLNVAKQCEATDVKINDMDMYIRNICCTDDPPREIDPVDFYMALMRGVESRDEGEQRVANELEKSGYGAGSPVGASGGFGEKRSSSNLSFKQ